MNSTIDELKIELTRFNIPGIELIYSEDSLNEYELSDGDQQSKDLIVDATLENLRHLHKNATVKEFWQKVVELPF